MKANANKRHLLISTNEERNISIEGEKIQNSKSKKLLGVTINNKLSFADMCMKSVIKLVKCLTHWLHYLVL